MGLRILWAKDGLSPLVFEVSWKQGSAFCPVYLLCNAFSSAVSSKAKTHWQAIKSILFDRAHEFAEHFLRTEKQHHLFPGSLIIICKIRLPERQCVNLQGEIVIGGWNYELLSIQASTMWYGQWTQDSSRQIHKRMLHSKKKSLDGIAFEHWNLENSLYFSQCGE